MAIWYTKESAKQVWTFTSVIGCNLSTEFENLTLDHSST